jgi:ComF family protein
MAGADALLAVAFAPRCAACGLPLDRPSAGPVCPDCWSAVRPLTPPLCTRCGEPLPSWRAASLAALACPRCRRRPSTIVRGASFGAHDGRLRDIVHAFKYDRHVSLSRPLARRLREHCGGILEGADLVVPVPLHWRRRRARGFNQAEELARHLGLPVVAALRRQRPTVPQAELPASRRHANVRGAFALTRRGHVRKLVRNRCVVLVDDVTTTGATLESCARLLGAAGAREVRALTVARALSRRP